jgi:hypothetical protein
MNTMALVLACLILLVPAAVAEEGPAGDQSDEVPCKFFSWTLTPPDYRIDPDCPPIAGWP